MRYKGIVVGLGNPGSKYANTRHNLGFEFIDKLLANAEASGSVEVLNGKKFHSELWRINMPQLNGNWLAAKPQTFMNESGRAVQPLLAWHNLRPDNLLVVQDELDIPAGSLRFKFGGGLAGHNGLLSISQHIGTKDFYRLRIGIGKPAHKDEMLAWVLGRPDETDRKLIDRIMPFAIETLYVFAEDGLDAAVQYAHAADKNAEAGLEPDICWP